MKLKHIVKKIKNKTEFERTQVNKDKTGVCIKESYWNKSNY